MQLIIAILALTLTTLAFAADQQVATDFGGKTADGWSWKVVQRNFTPGPTEVEFDLGRDVAKGTRLYGAYLSDNMGREYLGPMITNVTILDQTAVFTSATYFQGLENPSKIRLIAAATQPLSSDVSIGICGLWSKTEGKDAYWEVGPTIKVNVAHNPNVSIQLQPITKVGGGEGFNLFFSTNF